MSPTTAILSLPELPDVAVRARWGQLYGCARSVAIVNVAEQGRGPVLVLVADPRIADQLVDELRFFGGPDLPVLHFPDSETLPYDAFSPHPDITSRRLETLSRLPTLERGLVVAAVSTCMQRLPPPAWVIGSSLRLQVGQRLDIQSFRRRLGAAGYNVVTQVTEHGELAVRGELIDLFPMGSEQPYRIDMFDDEIESISGFDPDTQRSRDKLERVSILPAREYPFTPETIAAFRDRFRTAFPQDLSRVPLYRDVADGIAPGGIESYLPFFFDKTASLFDYLPADTLIVDVGPTIDSTAGQGWRDIGARYEQVRHDIEQPRIEPGALFLDDTELQGALLAHPCVEIQAFEHAAAGCNLGTAKLPPVRLAHRAAAPAAPLKNFLANHKERTLFTAESPGRREVLRQMLADYGVSTTFFPDWHSFLSSAEPVGLAIASLEEGAHFRTDGVAIVPEAELFGDRVRQRRRRRRGPDPASIISQLSDLSLDAPVVHENYGVGRYRGLQTMTAGGRTGEFLTLEYAGGDRLYVPVHSLDMVTRYMGASPDAAPLHRLGSDQWQKARRKAAKQARDVAAELLDIYARRAARTGHTHRYSEAEYRTFREEFPFEETPDQDETIRQVLDDLSAPLPMDRVVCGDVGFGKTEVAMRAAFAAVQSGRQVAVLVPTTLLAQQHARIFGDRFADWPVRIEVMSRFRSGKQISIVRDGLAAGQVDIVIGTHRLIQGDLRFKNLGLVIIDEEHRFGVRHKEQLRKLRAEVDVLTLTATPIPRTLNMAMGGLRDLSLMSTPPSERLAVKTFVTEWKDPVIREACLREIRRGGQIYFLHNRVESIEDAAAKLEKLVPEARVRIAHGQMRERELEQIMLDFYHRRFNVLVCTTIIESGIDVPTANTILIDRADRLGLAQLHQLRGRVGRSHHRAYAYLLTPHRSAMTTDAIKRLEAIESLEVLGAGFMLATQDLEIRGAGELLGEGQSGQIQEVGFAMYIELLERAVNAMKAGQDPDLSRPLEHGAEIEVGVSAMLPEDFVPDVHTRLVLYKRVAAASDDEALRELQVEFIDRFGMLPDAARMLFRIAELKLKAIELGIRRVEVGARNGFVQFRDQTQVEPVTIIRLVQEQGNVFRLDGQSKLRFNRDLEDVEARFAWARELLQRLDVGCKAA